MKYLLVLTLQIILTYSIAQKSQAIQKGQRIESSLSPGESKLYTTYLDSGIFIYGEVFQKDINTRTIVYGPDGQQRFRHGGEERGIDPIQFVTDQSGTYQFIVQGLERKGGKYSLSLIRAEPVARRPELRVDQLMRQFDNNTNPGAAIAVLKNGKVVFAKGYGMANLEYGRKITTTTPFQVASLSKQFTAFAIALLAKQGKLSLTDAVHKYIPELPDYDNTITLLDLIHHTGGLRDQWDLWELTGRRLDDILIHKELLQLIIQQRELNFEPREKISYTNSGYTLLAEVIERVTGLTFRTWMHENVFVPLKMSNTFVSDDHTENITGQATSYIYNESGVGKSALNSNNFGPTGIVSTVEDFVKWMRNFRTGEVGGPDVIKQIQEQGILSNGDTTYYAFGLGASKWKGMVRLGHHGSMAGYTSTMTYSPEMDAGIVIFSNNKNVLAGYFGSQILDSFFPELRIPQAIKQSRPAGSPGMPPEILENFVGRYTIAEGALKDKQFTITREGSRLLAHFEGKASLGLTAVNDSLFNVEGPDAAFQILFYTTNESERLCGNIIMESNSAFVKTPDVPPLKTLNQYRGQYYSPEIQSTYTVEVKDRFLLISNHRTKDIILEQTDSEHVFTGVMEGQYWLLREVAFLTDTNGSITGLRISSDRTKNLLFQKL